MANHCGLNVFYIVFAMFLFVIAREGFRLRERYFNVFKYMGLGLV